MGRRFLRKIFVHLCLLFLLTMTHSFVNAQPLEKLRVAYTVIAPTQATIWTAKEMGFYAKQGLDVDLVLLVGAPLAVTALVSGETPLSTPAPRPWSPATSKDPAPCWLRAEQIAFPKSSLSKRGSTSGRPNSQEIRSEPHGQRG